MSELLKPFTEMPNGGGVLFGIAVVACVTGMIVAIVAIYNLAYYGAVLFRGWPPEYEDDDDDDEPAGTFRTSETRTEAR